jgi:hypothetical protein
MGSSLLVIPIIPSTPYHFFITVKLERIEVVCYCNEYEYLVHLLVHPVKLDAVDPNVFRLRTMPCTGHFALITHVPEDTSRRSSMLQPMMLRISSIL